MGVELSVCKVDKRKWSREKLKWIKECNDLHAKFYIESCILFLDKKIKTFSKYDEIISSLRNKNPLSDKKFKSYPFVGENCINLSSNEILILAEDVKELFSEEWVSRYYKGEGHWYRIKGNGLDFFLSAIKNIQEEKDDYNYVWNENQDYITIFKIEKKKWPYEYLDSLFQQNSFEFYNLFVEEIELFEMRKFSHPYLMHYVYDYYEKNGIDMDKVWADYPLLPEYSGMGAYPLPSLTFKKILIEIKQEIDYLHEFEKEMLTEVFKSKEKGESHPFEQFIDSEKKIVKWGYEEIKKFAGPTVDYFVLFEFEEDFNSILQEMESKSYKHNDYEYVFWYH